MTPNTATVLPFKIGPKAAVNWAMREYPQLLPTEDEARADLMDFVEEFDRVGNIPWESEEETRVKMYEAWAVSVMTREAGGEFSLQSWIMEKYGIEHDDPVLEDGRTLSQALNDKREGGSFNVSAEGE